MSTTTNQSNENIIPFFSPLTYSECINLQEQIFDIYLPEWTKYVNRRKNNFLSPFRKDNKKTCTVFFNKYGILIFRDWSLDKGFNCVQLVSYIYNINTYKTLLKITKDLQGQELKYKVLDNSKHFNNHQKIDVEWWDIQNIKSDFLYFKQYGITLETLKKYKVVSILSIKGENWNYVRSNSRKCVGYYLGKEEDIEYWKFYFYDSDRNNMRFAQNTPTHVIQGINQISKFQDLIITKSLKDVMVLYEMGFESIAPMSENILLPENIIRQFKGKIYSLMDFDYTGVVNSCKMKRKYNVIPIFFTNGRFNTVCLKKDVSDMVLEYGFNQTKNLLTYYLNHATDKIPFSIYSRNNQAEIDKILHE